MHVIIKTLSTLSINLRHTSISRTVITLKNTRRYTERMPVFTQVLNPITGQNEWNLQDEDYDYKQEVARSSFADMLHDKERNDKYYEGIRRSVALLRKQKKAVHVLDIGTGTGLLSMMALSCGVDSVTACEAFSPMAECAQKVLEINGFRDKINLIAKRSTELEVGPSKDMPHRANLLVTEVFDTELIGEGALETFSHAKEHLLTEDALIVPSEGTIYAQVISSDLIKRWNKISPIIDNSTLNGHSKKLLIIPETVENCAGAAAVHDLQLSELPRRSFCPISNPIPVFEFDWSGRKIPLKKDDFSKHFFKSLVSADCDAALMWWDLKMDPEGEVILSCAPLWDHPKTKGNPETAKSDELPWRDHWMQAIYYFPKSISVQKDDQVTLLSSHDEYSLWFDVFLDSNTSPSKRPVCDCGLHATASRTRLGQLNDSRRRSFFIKLLKRDVTSSSVCLFIGDCCLLAIVAAKLGARHVYVQQANGMSKRILSKFIESNNVADKVTILSAPLTDISLESLISPITFVFSEPYFDTSLLPWHSMQFLYRVRNASHLFGEKTVILPDKVTIKGVPVQFRDLWKIRSPLQTCSGFLVQPFDELIEKASEETDERVEPQPLWEYPGTALGDPVTLLSFPLSSNIEEGKSQDVALIADHHGTLNGLALWADWHFGDKQECLTTGPVEEVVPGREIIWDMYTRQGVCLLQDKRKITKGKQCRVNSKVNFVPRNGSVNFEFEICDK